MKKKGDLMHSFYGTRLSENMAETPEGYLICYDVKIARIGTQDYLGSELGVDDDVVKVDRPAKEVFKPATVASFEGKPFTNDHPYELLDVNNTPIYEKGHVQNVRISDDKIYLIADIMVKDNQTIQDIKNGKRELSAGYNCDCLQDEAGNWYQANIIGNHVALVDKGRAGEKVRINDAEWNEADHPRAKNGQFGKGSGEATSGDKNMKSYEEAKAQAEKRLEYVNEKLKEKNSPEKHSNLVASKYELEDAIKYYTEQANKEKSEGKEASKSEKTPNLNSEEINLVRIISHSDEEKDLYNRIKNNEKLENTEVEGLIKSLNKVNTEPMRNLAKKLGETYGVDYTPAKKSYLHNGMAHIQGEPIPSHYTGERAWKEAHIKWASMKLPELMAKHSRTGGYDRDIKALREILANDTETTKEKPMKDNKSVLGKLLKAFAKDAEPEEMVEALEAVKGKEDEEPDRLTKLETLVQDLCKRMDAYDEAQKPEEKPEVTALDEVEKEIADEEPEEGKKEVEDADAENDPKLIEAISEKAQEDEDTTEEIKKEIADAKKVVARIEDKEVRLAVADSLAKVIRGKMKSSDNYKKLMDASKKKPVVDSKAIDYKEVFKKIKDEKFRK